MTEDNEERSDDHANSLYTYGCFILVGLSHTSLQSHVHYTFEESFTVCNITAIDLNIWMSW